MWGDEAKAKIVDFLGETADVVVRFQGGANAGHTIVVDGIKYVFHSVPSGMLYPDVKCVIGSGVIVDPRGIKAEIEKLMEAGIDFSGRLFIDERAAMVLSIHKELDLTSEQRLGKAKIGTTGRGIGPAYADRVARRAIRLVDLRFPTWLRADHRPLCPPSSAYQGCGIGYRNQRIDRALRLFKALHVPDG